MKLPLTSAAGLVCCCLLASAQVDAQMLAIGNAGFEQPTRGDGGFSDDMPIPDWTLLDPDGLTTDGAQGTYGVFNIPVAAYPAEAPEGANAGYIFLTAEPGVGEVALSQSLPHVLTVDKVYTLRIAVGNPMEYDDYKLEGFPGYRIELLAGGIVLNSDEGTLTPAEGSFLTSEVVFQPPPGHPNLGEPLEIRLVNTLQNEGREVDFDDVRLTAVDSTDALFSSNFEPLDSSGR